MRGLGFCVSVAHAEYMARRVQRGGHPGRAVSGTTPRPNASGPGRPARAPSQHPLRRRPLQRRPRRSRRRHGAVPAADGERHGLPAAAGPRAPPHARQGRADGAGLRRLPPQGVPLRPQAARADRGIPARGLERARGQRVPVPARRLPDRDGPAAQAIVLDNIRSQIANRWPQIVAELRSYGDQTSRRSSRDRARALRHPASGIAFVDAAASRRGPAHRTRALRWRTSCSSGCARSPTSTTRSALAVPTVAPRRRSRRTAICRRPSSASRECCSTRSGHDGGGHASFEAGFDALR